MCIRDSVWQAEADLDKTKVFVSGVTVLGDDVPLDSLPGEAYTLDRAPAIEDCVAIEQLRTARPTAFSNVTYQLDKQNALFVQVSALNYANQIQRRALERDGLVYEYCYPYDAGTVLEQAPAEGESTPMYYSIRKG